MNKYATDPAKADNSWLFPAINPEGQAPTDAIGINLGLQTMAARNLEMACACADWIDEVRAATFGG